MKMALQNYAVIIPIENSGIKFNSDKVNSLQSYNIAQYNRTLQ
jgi:hypothetical protein